MIVVIPFCSKDSHLVGHQLEWIDDLGKAREHDLLLVIDGAVQWSEAKEIIDYACKIFRKVDQIIVGPVEGWIPGSVALFSAAAQWCQNHNTDFLFLEPDAIPLKTGWLKTLEEAYHKCGKLFMGPIIKANDPRHPPFFMEGVSVYPAQAWSLMQPFITPKEAWVTSCASIVVPNCANTPLIHQIWGMGEGLPVRFVDKRTADSPPQDWTLDHLRKGAVLFHREKNNDLIPLLRAKMFPDRNDYSDPPIWVQMGRVGDLILMLPAWQAWADRSGEKTVVYTSQEFGGVLEGASYINRIMVPYSWYDAAKAKNLAQAQNPKRKVIVTQLHGTGLHTPPDDLPSYSLTMWRRTGLMEEYHTLPLIFDKRNPNREADLIARTLTSTKPFVLIKTDGWTSPFDPANDMRSVVREVFKDQVQIINLDKVIGQRVYDLLGLMDRALGAITTDTMSLHLLAASPCEYIAFTRDDGQSGSIPKGNCVLQIGYSQWGHHVETFKLQLSLWLAKALRESGRC